MDGADLASLTFASTDPLTSVAAELIRVLGLAFEQRSSDWRGGDYLVAGNWSSDEAELIYIQRNDDMGEPAEAEYEAYPTLVYVDQTRRADDLEQTLTSLGLVLVQRDSG